jgi:chemotaxis protein histidine kinase CheA/ActR/RegA family two-component response regulator
MSTTDPIMQTSLESMLTALAASVKQNIPTEGADADLSADALEQYVRQVTEISEAVDNTAFSALQDICMIMTSHLRELIESHRDIGTQEYDLLEFWPVLIMTYVQTPSDPETREQLLAHLQNPNWVTPVPDDYTEFLRELLTDPSQVDEGSAIEVAEFEGLLEVLPPELKQNSGAADEQPDTECGSADPLSPEQQELVDLLRAELADIIEAREEVFAVLNAGGDNLQAQGAILENYSDAAERIGEAADIVGLNGLQAVGKHIHDNFSRVSAEEPFSNAIQSILNKWPVHMLGYLQSIHDRRACEDLVNFLQMPAWPNPLSVEQGTALVETLVAATVSAEDANAIPRQAVIQSEDVSLEIPKDVNPELLESLLRELPDHTQQFSAAIQRATEGGFLSDIDIAQRVAHTLKGAANVVGVRGISTLAHHLEDILQGLSKQNLLPPRMLAETLMSAADCLETMGEKLLGICDAPTDAVEVLQDVLDWANRIDREDITTDGHKATNEVSKPPLKQTPSAATTAMAASDEPGAPTGVSMEATLRVPASLADDLLRLAGEKMISTGQIEEHVRRTRAQAESLHRQNQQLLQLGAELEQLVDVKGIWSYLSGRGGEGEFDALELNQYNELHTFTHRLVEATTDAMAITRNIEGELANLHAMTVDQDRLNKENHEAVMGIRMVPMQTIVPRLKRGVRQACRLTGKEVELHIYGAETLMDSNVLNDLIDPLMHLLRNAVDHGIEFAQVREARDKNPIGKIDMVFSRKGDHIAVRCQDDGAGLDYAAIREKASAQGLIPSDQALSEEKLTRIILSPGFSTRDSATQVSGRGIGMDAVQARVQEMKGRLSIQSISGQGMLVELALPVTLLSAHTVLVRVGEQIVAISNRGVEDILYSSAGEIQTMGSKLVYRLGNKVHRAEHLHSLLRLPGAEVDERDQDGPCPVLLVKRATGSKVAVLLNQVIETQDLVVKPLNKYTPKSRGVVGATILGDGSVAPVLDLTDILDVTGSQPAAVRADHTTIAKVSNSLPIALVVDDSLSARRSMVQFVQDIGYQVYAAKDGIEAVSIIEREGVPNVLLVDLEMPRMNGLELTAHIRAHAATQGIPVIMITSRSTEKHRQQAEAVGVDAYLTKPYSEDELLTHLQANLGQAS